MDPTTTSPPESLQTTLQTARKSKRLSQLELALRMGVSQRHVSFVESGRAQPSRELLLSWLHELQAPLALRNAWRGGDFTVDFEQDVFTKAGHPLRLTPNEKRLLAALVKVPGKVLTRAELINLAFDEDFDSYDRVVDTHIKNLRQKIEDDPRHPVYLLTVHGRGYRFGGE